MSKRNKKVKILVGVPASGKSTWTREYLAKNPNAVAVSRDDFRYGLRNSGITEPKIEDMITDLVDTTIVKSLNKGLDVVVDATNLKASYINHFVELVKYKADIEFQIFDISLEKAIERDSKRERKVGEAVIKKMYKQYKLLIETYPLQNISKEHEWKDRFVPLKQNKRFPEAVLFDIDGTLAFMNNRGPFEWDKVDRDDLNESVAEQIKFHKSLGRKIILLSGRDEEAREKTEYWLNFYGIEYDELLMRPKDNWEKDNVIKKRIFNQNLLNRYNVICVYDDRLQVVKMWYELGIFCFNCNQGNKDF